jgi:hypothetical protein
VPLDRGCQSEQLKTAATVVRIARFRLQEVETPTEVFRIKKSRNFPRVDRILIYPSLLKNNSQPFPQGRCLLRPVPLFNPLFLRRSMFNDGLNHSQFRTLSSAEKIQILRLYIEVMQEKVAEARNERDIALNQLRVKEGLPPLDPQVQREEDWIYLGQKLLQKNAPKGAQ